jgi:hypothetical protein
MAIQSGWAAVQTLIENYLLARPAEPFGRALFMLLFFDRDAIHLENDALPSIQSRPANTPSTLISSS